MIASSKPDHLNGRHANAAQLSAGFSNLDIGSPQLSGSAALVESGWDLTAGGADIWEKSDQLHFLY